MIANEMVSLGKVSFSNSKQFSLIAGPCAMESCQHAFDMAGMLKEICQKLNLELVYKSSFDKANRTSLSAERGIGLDKAIEIFDAIKMEFDIPILTDIHNNEQCQIVATHVDILQIPAFLCRQTDLLVSAARTNIVINLKKGQFLAPWDIRNAQAKIVESGNPNVLLTERGTSFGYNTLIVDFRGLPIMASMGSPVIFDATHSIQHPGGDGKSTSGNREFISVLSRAAIAVGVAGIFIETHNNPLTAPSDSKSMMPLNEMPAFLEQLLELDRVAKNNLNVSTRAFYDGI